MNHREALESNAADRYLLNEMSGPEREQFEDHFFGCVDCAEEVRTGAALARGVRAVYGDPGAADSGLDPDPKPRGWRFWFSWLTPPALIPAGAALALALVAVYQNLVVIPSLRSGNAAAAVTATVLKASTRGDTTASVTAGAGPVAVLSMDVNGVPPGAPIQYELRSPDGSRRVSGTATSPPSGQPLLLVVRDSDLHTPGTWTVVIGTSSGAELGRYPFLLELK